MIWPVRYFSRGLAPRRTCVRSAYTLIEILVSTALTLMLLMAVVQIFGSVSESIANSRAALEMADQLRAAQMTLQRDLEGVTATMTPPRRPESGEGYFEYTEGPIGPAMSIDAVAMNTQTPSGANEPDSTVGDIDDMVLFTTRTRSSPFVGRVSMIDAAGNSVNSAESQEAEVIWFMRGPTLYRRVLLVLPNFDANLTASGVQMQLGTTPFYRDYDLSVRNSDGGGALAANSLSDLTKPENRFAHRITAGTPFHAHFAYSGTNIVRSAWANLGLPTLCECSADGWVAGKRLPTLGTATVGTFDAWLNPHPSSLQDPATGVLKAYMGPRVGEDVVLTNVIGFDVKAWDPTAPVLLVSPGGSIQPYTLLPGDRGYMLKLREYLNGSSLVSVVSYGAYVDLNYLCRVQDPSLPGTAPTNAALAPLNNTSFGWAGNARSRVRGMEPITTSSPSTDSYRSSVYDTWSTHYEYDGVDTDDDSPTNVDEGTNGFDDNGDGVVDDANEQEMPPPYAASLRGIQVRIRVFDPASRQIREVTVVQDFLPK
jgi:type II secretory pathway component PulJ